LTCDEFKVTAPTTGESFKHFSVKRGDLMIGDRNFGKKPGIAHVVAHGGHVLVRINLTNTVFFERANNRRFDIVEHLSGLRDGDIGDWDVCVNDEGNVIAGRICAIKKSIAAAEKAKRKIRQEAKKKKRQTRPETLKSAEYVFVFTTLGRNFSADKILEIYRVRWQVELAFKRLKSLLKMGDLTKFDPSSVMAWIHAKLLIAVLIEAARAAGNSFFPWGYPIHEDPLLKSVHIPGNSSDVALPEPSR
jgi:ribosomal protein S9